MNNFTRFISESTYDGKLTIDKLNNYIEKTNRILPEIVKDVLYIIKKYMILDVVDINNIISTSKSGLKTIAVKLNISMNEIEDLWRMLKDLKSNIKLLPHFMSDEDMKALINGKLKIEDLTIDLNSQAGRNHIVKMYMPLAYKIVNQYIGKSKLSKQDLISAAMLAFSNAMNDWNKEKGSNFKTYVSFRIKQQILNDIDKISHTLSAGKSIPWYLNNKDGQHPLDASSIDSMPKNSEGELKQDRLSSLGIEDIDTTIDRDEDKQWKQIYGIIEKKFSQRDVDIFYRYFGIHGYKKEKSKDIARDYKMSEGNIRNSVINKIIAYLKRDKNAMEILSNLQDIYNESLMIDLFGSDVETIKEALYNDDVFILLEELNRWNNKDIFNRALNKSVVDDNIMDIIKGDFDDIDSNLKKYKKEIILFLTNMYPTENMSRKTDVDLIEYMLEIQEYYKKYNK